MKNVQKFFTELSDEHVDSVEKKRIKDERHQNRFNYFNCITAVLALVLSIISILLQVC